MTLYSLNQPNYMHAINSVPYKDLNLPLKLQNLIHLFEAYQRFRTFSANYIL